MYYDVTEKSLTPDFYLCERNIDVFCITHIHYYMEIAFVVKGELILTKGDKTLHLKKGEMAIVMPYEIHGYKTAGNSDMLVLGFQPEYISEYKKMFSGKTFENPVAAMNERIKSVVMEFLHRNELDIFEIKSAVYCAISEFMKNSGLKDSTVSQNDTFRKALMYISAYYTEDISLKKVAAEIGVTSVHLSRILSAESVMGFTEIVNCMRIREAKRLLEETDMPISELAYEAGFGSIRNFNRICEKYFGCKPKEIRNKSVKINFLVKDGNVEE